EVTTFLPVFCSNSNRVAFIVSNEKSALCRPISFVKFSIRRLHFQLSEKIGQLTSFFIQLSFQVVPIFSWSVCFGQYYQLHQQLKCPFSCSSSQRVRTFFSSNNFISFFFSILFVKTMELFGIKRNIPSFFSGLFYHFLIFLWQST